MHTINPPLYLAVTTMMCWKCKDLMPVICLIAPKIDGQEYTCILQNVQALPPAILVYIQEQFPNYKLKKSQTLQSEYYGNTCPSCGSLTGDFYILDDPQGPFDGMNQVWVDRVPIESPIEVDASITIGLGEMILGRHLKDPKEDN